MLLLMLSRVGWKTCALSAKRKRELAIKSKKDKERGSFWLTGPSSFPACRRYNFSLALSFLLLMIIALIPLDPLSYLFFMPVGWQP